MGTISNIKIKGTNYEICDNKTRTDIDALITSVRAIAEGTPKGAYDTLVALQTAYPLGDNHVYVVVDDNKWYYYNGTAWSPGGTYQSSLGAAHDSEVAAAASALSALNSATDAASSESTATQAMSDLLAMVGSDIATLVGGKVPMDQLPASAIVDIHSITLESEMTGLTAQRGDLAELITDVGGIPTITKTFQLLGDGNPAIISNWIVWGTSYAVQAGNATTADNALNANTVNGHRLVTMYQSPYVGAVTEDGTVYLVFPDEV